MREENEGSVREKREEEGKRGGRDGEEERGWRERGS